MHHLWITVAVMLIWISSGESHEASLCVSLCAPCTPQKEILGCPPEPECPEKVKEPGCSCCMVCALKAGERCGLNMPKCINGLECLGQNGENTLAALLANRGVCQVATATSEPETVRATANSRKTRRKAQRRGARRRRHPHHGILNTLNFRGLCSNHYEDLMTSCLILPPVVWIPSCDDHGDYIPQQCETTGSNGKRRCWCSYKNGTARVNSPYAEHVDCSA